MTAYILKVIDYIAGESSASLDSMEFQKNKSRIVDVGIDRFLGTERERLLSMA